MVAPIEFLVFRVESRWAYEQKVKAITYPKTPFAQDCDSVNTRLNVISFFNKKSISALAQKAGFKVEHFQTHRVSYCEPDEAPYFIYRLLKLLADLSNLPAKLSGKGHEMRVYLRKISS